MGGDSAVSQATALTWDADAAVHANGRVIDITGQWSVHPPDTAIVDTYDVTRGPSTRRALVLAAPRGWVVAGKEFTPLPEGALANERDEFYLYHVMRLVSLRTPDVTLAAIPPDSLGQRGFRAKRSGRPDVDLWVDTTGRVRHLRLLVADPSGGAPVLEDAWLDGTIDAGGIHWPRTIKLTLHGAPYFDLTIRALRTHARLADSLLARLPKP
jgi:hypothetical protein